MGRRGSKYCEKCGCYMPEGETACVSCGYDPTAPTSSKCTDWVYPTSMICDSKNYTNICCQSNTPSEIYNRDSQAVAQCHTFLPVDYAQLVNVAPKVRQRTLDEVLDELEKESIYEQLAQAINQTSCSTVQASEAFTQLARNHRDAQKQVMLHEVIWAKGGKGNQTVVAFSNCVKSHMDRGCIGNCDYCYLEKEDKDIYTNSILRTYRCKKYPYFPGRVEKQNG